MLIRRLLRPTLFPYTTLFRSGLVTPIGAMLSILELVPGEVLTLQSPVVLNGQVYNAVALGPTTDPATLELIPDRKSTRLNSSHVRISYAVFCLKKKNIQ